MLCKGNKNYGSVRYGLSFCYFPLTHRDVAMTKVMPLVLFKLQLKFPDFIFNKDHPLPPIEWGELRQYGNHACFEQDPLANFKGCKGDIWFFTERDWIQECWHGNTIVGVILFLL